MVERIKSSEINPVEIINKVKQENHGGNVVFIGTVRSSRGKRTLSELYYEVYKDYAERRMEEVLKKVEKKFPKTRIEIEHRYGSLKPGEISVVIAVSSVHRREAFKACMYAIDLVKKNLPIWKKEKYSDGKEYWIRGETL